MRNLLTDTKRVLLIAVIFFSAISCSDKSNPVTNTVKPPVISSLSVDSLVAGTELIITGQEFGDTRDTSFVLFGTIKPTASDYVSWSATSIKVKVPNIATSCSVYVNVKGQVSNAKYLKISAPPELKDTIIIYSISPDSSKIGDVVTITGGGFGNTQGTAYVDFNGTKAKDYSVWKNEQIQVKVPANAVSGLVSVHLDERSSNKVNYKIYEPYDPTPVLTSVLPVTDTIGATVRLVGSKFGATKGSNFVKFNNTTALLYTSWADGEILVKVPQGATTGNITINVNGYTSNGVYFTVKTIQNTGDPEITNLEANSGQIGTSIGIQGKNFGTSQGQSYVEFNGTKAVTYSTWTDTRIVVAVPTGATSGLIKIYVNSKSSNGVQFEVKQALQILELVSIPKGSFQMGPFTDDFGEHPAHNVIISKAFNMSAYEITQEQWKKVMDNSNPSKVKNDKNPVEQVTFARACEFCNRLSAMEKLNPCYTIDGDNITCDFSANGYRLPTEAEWEYACRAGSTTDYGGSGIIGEMGWTNENSSNAIHNVGLKKPNLWGLYDMHGNVAEWCWDWFDTAYYESSATTDPTGPTSGFGERVIRGGSYLLGVEIAKSRTRSSYSCENGNCNLDLGFRVLRLQ